MFQCKQCNVYCLLLVCRPGNFLSITGMTRCRFEDILHCLTLYDLDEEIQTNDHWCQIRGFVAYQKLDS